MTDRAQYRAETRVAFTELSAGGAALLHLGTKMYFTLNETGAHVWKALQAEPQSVASLGASLTAAFECTEEQAERDVEALLRELIREGLVHPA